MKSFKDCIHEYIEQMKNIQISLLEYIDDETNSEDDFQFLDNQSILCNRYKFKSLLYMITQIANNYHRHSNFFTKIEKVLDHIKIYIQEHFSKYEIFKIFEINKRVLLFLIKSKILILTDQIISDINNNNDLRYYFSQEIESSDNQILKIPENFDQIRQNGENDRYICELIREDSLDTFIPYATKNNIDFKSRINPSFFETNSFLIKKKPSLIEYASFCGSINIFSYLLSKGVELTSSLWMYSIHGNNAEIIQMLEDHHIEPDDVNKVYNESIKCFYHPIEEYIKDNHYNPINEPYMTTCFHFQTYNFNFNEELHESNLKSLFFLFVEYDYPYCVDQFVQNKIGNNFVNEYFPPTNDDCGNKVEYTPLIYSCDKGNYDVANILLNFKNINVNKLSRTSNGIQKTALYISIERENVKIIKELINKDDTDVNITSKQNYENNYFIKEVNFSPLLNAVKKGNIEIIKLLLKQSYIDVNFVNTLKYTNIFDHNRRVIQEEKITSLYYAVRYEKIEIVKLLLQRNDIDVNNINKYYKFGSYNDEETCLINAVKTRNHEMFHLLLSKNNIDLNCRLNKGDLTVLCYAIENNDMEVIKVLLSRKTIDVNAKSYIYGGEKTPLYYAVTKQNIEVIKLLLAHQNIDVNAFNGYNKFDDPSSHSTVRKTYDFIINILELKENDDDQKCELFIKQTVLHLAVDKENIQVINLLLEHKDIDVNIRTISDDLKATPLYLAVKDKKNSIAKLLLQHENIDVNILNEIKDSNNHSVIESVLFTAYENKDFDIFNLLMSRNDCVINSTRKRIYNEVEYDQNKRIIKKHIIEETLLHDAIERKCIDFIKILLDHQKIDVNKIREHTVSTKVVINPYKDDITTTLTASKTTALHLAIDSQSIETIELLLKNESLDVNLMCLDSSDDTKISPLNLAIEKGNEKIVSLLLSSKNIDVNTASRYKDGENKTPLILAVEKQNHSIVKLLLDDPRIDANLEAGGKTALQIAVIKGYTEIVKIFVMNSKIDLNKQTDDEKAPLNISCEQENIEIIQLLLKSEKIDVNVASEYKWYDEELIFMNSSAYEVRNEHSQDKTPLINSILNENIEITKILLEQPNIDVNLMTRYTKNYEIQEEKCVYEESEDKNAFLIAIEKGNIDIIQLLLNNKKIDFDSISIYSDSEGKYSEKTGLIIATEKGNVDIVQLLLQSFSKEMNIIPKASKYLKYTEDWTIEEWKEEPPLNIAVQSNDLKIVQLLLKSDLIDINESSKTTDYFSKEESKLVKERTALHIAVEKGNLEIIKLLLDNGIDTNKKDEQGKTAIEYTENDEIKQLLS